MSKSIGFLLLLCFTIALSGQDFTRHFRDSTLRIDYTFAGRSGDVAISRDELHSSAHWYGRRVNLSHLALRGNGRIVVKDSASRELIYTNSFSSLFQEWLSTDEAQKRARSFEHTLLIPYPNRSALIEVELDNMRQEPIARDSFYFSPNDILVRHHDVARVLPHHYLHRAKRLYQAIDIAILAEGFTQEEMPKFMAYAKRSAQELLSYEPFKTYQENINIIAVETISEDSGVSLPREGKWLNTAFASHFDTFYSERYLTTSRVRRLHDALINIPYEHIIILANTEVYGGGGIFNSYTLSSIHPKSYLPVVVHEFGHSFGGLADEYFYESDAMNNSYNVDAEPWEQNITSLKDFKGKKWSSLIKSGTPIPTPKGKTYKIGAYEGAAYTAHGLYKATQDCRMLTNTFPTFCPACHKALNELIRYYLYPQKR